MNKEIFEKSIILVGPIGCGKSLLSEELGNRTNMPVVTTDLLRHCPKNIEQINQKIEFIENKINEIKKENNQELLNKLKNELYITLKQKELRILFPTVKNYEEMGFKHALSTILSNRFGDVAWHFYQKQYENRLLISILKNLNQPCIIDTGGGMSICLSEEYKKLDEKFRKIDEELYLENINLSMTTFYIIKKAFQPFKNVIELKLPDDYSEFDKATNAELNKYFIESGQYSKVATRSINVNNLIKGNTYNEEKLDEIVGNILNNKIIKK